MKGHRAVVNSKKLSEAGEAVEWFFKSGVSELREKLGPVLWQLAPFKKFDAADLAGFFALLPRELGGTPVRHALEVRSQSFLVPEFVELAARHSVAIVYADFGRSSGDSPILLPTSFMRGCSVRLPSKKADIPQPTSTSGRVAQGDGQKAMCPRI